MKIRRVTLQGFFKKEFTQIVRDPKMLFAIFFIPLIQTVMFGLALTSEVKNVELSVLATPNSLVARDIQARAQASSWF